MGGGGDRKSSGQVGRLITDIDELTLPSVEDAVFGLSVAAKLGTLERAVATAIIREMDANSACAWLSTKRVAAMLQEREPRVLAALAVLQEKGLIKVCFEPNVPAMAALGGDYRATLRRMGHEA